MFPRLRSCLLLITLILGLGLLRADAYIINGYKWPFGTQIMMHLGLENSPQPALQDGSATWNDSAADALNIWNQNLAKVTFVAAGAVTPGASDGQNSIFFSNQIYGENFDSTTLAVTLNYSTSTSGVFTETDVIFNNLFRWDSYRGPLQRLGTGYLYDLHRVALHEFGHVLGLDHPDTHGQTVVAIMNSIISDLDSLADDDIAGVWFLYGYKITSPLYVQPVTSGSAFSYQITSEGNPTSFKASGLPPGLQVTASTGVISGHVLTTGSFTVMIEADTPRGAATGTFALTVSPALLTSSYSPPSILIGDSFSYQIKAANNPTSFSATGLPAGLTLDANTGIISGTPTVTGTYSVMVLANGASAIAGGTIQITILPPQITSSLNSLTLNLGDPFTYQITATHHPTSFAASGLPSEFQLDPSTGIISGTAATPGSYFVTVKAHTSFGDASGGFSITILPPHITNTTQGLGQIGQPFDYQVTASNHPISFAADTLPAGLQLNTNTGEITGVPTLSGSYVVHLTIHTAVGDGGGYVSIFISSATSVSPSVANFSLGFVNAVLADPSRSRIYVGSSNGLAVIDTGANAIIKQFGNYNVTGLALSPDDKTLYFTTPSAAIVLTLDLDTLQSLSVAASGRAPLGVAAGADGYLYITDANVNGFVYQIDPATGTQLGLFTAASRSIYPAVMIRTTPDHKTLLVAEINHTAPTVSKFYLNGGAPTLTQEIDAITPNELTDIAFTSDGAGVAFISYNSTTPPPPTSIRSVADLTVTTGTLPAPLVPADLAFTPDGLYAIQTYSSGNRVDTIRVATGTIERSTTVSGGAAIGIASTIAIVNDSSKFYVVSSSRGNIFAYVAHGPAVPVKSLMNVSTRLRTETGDNVAIGGFIIEGSAPKTVLIRALGPTLKSFGLTDTLADPTLELHAADGSIITANDNWNEHRNDVLNTNLWPSDEHEAAIVATLNPGNYTAILRGVNDTSGIALMEVYDVDPASVSRVKNISTRGHVETADDVMIGGFIVGGDQPTKVIVSAIGPSLAQFNVAGVLADPTLDLYDANGNNFASNDNWATTQRQEILDSGYAPSDPREAAIVQTLQPGAYTAIVRGANNTTGVALVQIFNLENP